MVKAKKKPVKRKTPAVKRAKKITLAKGLKVKRGVESKLEKKPGGSNVGKYKKVSKKEFCGPSGGAPEGSFPVDTAKRCRAALAYAHNAPNPKGIRACVKKKCKGEVKEFKKKK
jgi:hypothetical protein